jgi:hypothetical protein
MNGDNPRGPVPGEQAALAELERLQRAIEESRKRRLAANEAYDSFMQSFDAPPKPRVEPAVVPPPAPVVRAAVPPIEAPVVPPVVTRPAASAEPPNVDMSPAWRSAEPEPRVPIPEPPKPRTHDPLAAISAEDGVGLDEFPEEIFRPGELTPRKPEVDDPVEMAWGALDRPLPPAQAPSVPAAFTPAPARTGRSHGGLIALAAVIVLAAAVVVWRMLPSASPDQAESTAPNVSASQAPSASTPPPAAVAPAPAVQARPPKAELTTLRRVWVRVLVDGERALERELDADVRVPFDPKALIVVRAGDAGALRVSIDGKDQGALGRDGFPVTRTFPVSPSPVR